MGEDISKGNEPTSSNTHQRNSGGKKRKQRTVPDGIASGSEKSLFQQEHSPHKSQQRLSARQAGLIPPSDPNTELIVHQRRKRRTSTPKRKQNLTAHQAEMTPQSQPTTELVVPKTRKRRRVQDSTTAPGPSNGETQESNRDVLQSHHNPPKSKQRISARQAGMLPPAQRKILPKPKYIPAALRVDNLPTQPHTLAPTTVCLECGATKFEYESLHFCCGNGSIKLAETEYPPELLRLFTSSDEDARNFQMYSRLYNNMFAFSSIGGEIKPIRGNGLYVFKLQGQIYHNVPNLLPGTRTPAYLQLYFYDGQQEAQHRCNVFPEIREDIVNLLITVTEVNPYARFFRSLKEFEVTETTQIVLNTRTVPDQRTYNAPTSDEVAVIWTEASSSSESSSPHIIVAGKGTRNHRIQHYFGCYDPLAYPLMAPNGESGWHQGIKKIQLEGTVASASANVPIHPDQFQTPDSMLAEEATRAEQVPTKAEKNVSCREYYCYKLQARPNNMLLKAGRCLQQYIVDMYVKIENTRLDFFRRNQETIRAELYQGVLDTVQAGETRAANIGHRIILPPSFLGGFRDLKRRYLNAMALVQRFGKPDLFITMTCNANWPEITAELETNQLAQNRPELVTRVFRAKLLALKKQITQEKVFGEVAALIYVVEFQKRGLPHAHFLIILQTDSKIKTPDDFDKYVSAEIPPKSNDYLHSLVLKHMMHGPCGVLNPLCPCMLHKHSAGKCKSQYPKAFTTYTTNRKDGYPLYRRRDDGRTELVRRAMLDNRWVIPYNQYLIALFNCHINVEVCSTIEAVKYLYKYVYKGHDKVSFDVVPGSVPKLVDEISQYQDGRWVSPCEAAWRIFEFALFEMHPPVMPLQVHLPNMQTVAMNPHENLTNVIANERRSRTPLTEYFNINRETGGTGYLYVEFSEHYRWCLSNKKWFLRKTNAGVIGRLTFAAPAEGERFYLRLLLHNVRSAKSYDDLKTVDGQLCETFQEAALKLGLLEEDDAVDLCFKEACAVDMPGALRRLFATVLIFCQPSNPTALWNKYYSELSTDFTHKWQQDANKILRLTVGEVEHYVEAMGKTMAYFGLEHLTATDNDEIRRTRDIVDALDAPIPSRCIESIDQLNAAQQIAFDTIISHVVTNKPGAFFIDGPGGTGKTFLYNALYARVRLMNRIVLPTATSGIAASNIPSGRTAHSRFKIPLDISVSLACDVSKQSSLAALIKESALIIWDEASMARKESIESVDLLLRDLCRPDLLFGGKIIVFGGDFRQVLPVLPRKSIRDVVAASLVNSTLWPHLTRFTLSENIRARTDPEFCKFLLALGNGEMQQSEAEFVPVPAEIICNPEKSVDTVTAITKRAFPELEGSNFGSGILTGRAILTPMNEDVDMINAALISEFTGTAVTYKSFDSLLDDNCNLYPAEFLNKLCPGGMAPHELILKQNCPVILLRNLLPSAGLCNGTQMLCKQFYPNLIECEITSGQNSGERVFIPRINLRPAGSANYPFRFQRKQFPIKLSFAMTINKSQGQTLDQVAIYLPKPVFAPGQLYVALSRARKASQVSVVSISTDNQPSSVHLKNIVSYDILTKAGIIAPQQETGGTSRANDT